MSLLRSLRTPTASSSSLLPSLLSFPSTSTHSFSTSTINQESKSKRKSRLTKKNHIERKATLLRSEVLSRPDPILGYAKGKEELWENSMLNNILLNRKEVWGEVIKVVPGETLGSVSSSNSTSTTTSPDGIVVEGENYIPKYFNFGLTSDSVDLLHSVLPKVAAQKGLESIASESAKNARATQALEIEEEKRDKLMRIVDLRNASSKGIEVENVRRIVELFGRKEGDTGSPEVQAAIMTSRIHSLTAHLISSPRDIHNRRPLRSLIQQRAKVLKYLKSKDVTRYQSCLEMIGVEARAVEDEVIVTKEELRMLIKGV